VEMKRSSNDSDTYELYRKYQTAIHHDDPDDITERQFKRFLVDSPLVAKEGWPVPGLGSCHQKYYYDGRLIAVAVLDILPECVSSVYLMYDPDFADWSLGNYSALREIMLTHTLTRHHASLKYYCMGLYIHSCSKMRYKGQYRPSQLLDPDTNIWQPLANYLPHLDAHPYVTFAEDSTTPALERMADKDRPAPGIDDWHALSEDVLEDVAVFPRTRIIYANVGMQ
ncbi:arginine-tRNA-protein transferase, partial [Syncephalis pseudoplumigaleata]